MIVSSHNEKKLLDMMRNFNDLALHPSFQIPSRLKSSLRVEEHLSVAT